MAITRFIRSSYFFAIAVFALASPSIAVDDLHFHYMYFDEPQLLTLDVSRVAVRSQAGIKSDQPLSRTAVDSLDLSTVEPIGIDRWQRIGLTTDAADAVSMQTTIANLAADPAVDFASPVFTDERGLPISVTQDILIGFAKDVAQAEARKTIAQEIDGELLEENFGGLNNVYRVRCASRNGFEVLSKANQLATRSDVLFAESDMIVQGTTDYIPNDPQFGSQWALSQPNDEDMDAPEAWDITTGDSSIIAVVMDMGVQQGHPDLQQVPGQDFTGNNVVGGGPFNSCDNHATAVAGCISATIDNNAGVVGVAPGCRVASAKIGTTQDFFGIFCLGSFDSQPSMIVNALAWTNTIGARVTNSSFGYSNSSAMTTAYNTAKANGIINFAATGNDGSGTIGYPSNLASVVAVGAMNASGTKASFGQYGTGIAFSAPGEAVLTTDRSGSAGYDAGDTVSIDGTSFASPYAAGVAALVLSRNPSLTPSEVEAIMNQSCVDKGAAGYDTTYGWGFVNAANAVAAVASCSPNSGDIDCDGDVDDVDLSLMVDCLAGPNVSPAPFSISVQECLDAFDFNLDGDVDLADFMSFQAVFTG